MRLILCAVLLSLGLSAQAALHDRGAGLIYDDIQDITWLQNPKYANVVYGYNASWMTWAEAMTWADGLSYYDSVRQQTYDDWRLPVTGIPDPSCSEQSGGKPSERIGTGTACTLSEMGHLFNVSGIGYYSPNSPGPFLNVSSGDVLSATEVPGDSDSVMIFEFGNGTQRINSKSNSARAWLVRDGDVAASVGDVIRPLDYIYAESEISVESSLLDEFSGILYEYYNLRSGPPAGELDEFSDAHYGEASTDSWNRVSGTLSGLADATGFSLSGTVETWGMIGDADCFAAAVLCNHSADLARTVRFKVAEQQTLYFVFDWSNLQGTTEEGNYTWASGSIRLSSVTHNTGVTSFIAFEEVGHRNSPAVGHEVYSYTVDPGIYEVDLLMRASSGVTFAYQQDPYAAMTGTLKVSTNPDSVDVGIDVQPGDETNLVQTDGDFSDKMFVSIEGSDVFDASQIDSASVKFGPTEISPFTVPGNVVDTNSDGYPDMRLKFRIADTGFSCGLTDEPVTLTGETNGGLIQFEGTDTVTTEECETSCHP